MRTDGKRRKPAFCVYFLFVLEMKYLCSFLEKRPVYFRVKKKNREKRLL